MPTEISAPAPEPPNYREGSAPRNLPCYFALLEVENVHCFGSKQTLNLLTKQGGFAQWTILLGDNGMGKTTLLQCLAAMLPAATPTQDATSSARSWRPHLGDYEEWYGGIGRVNATRWQVDVTVTYQQDDGWQSHLLWWEDFKVMARTISYRDEIRDFTAYGYGAMRRLHRSEGAETQHSDPCATLFDDGKALLNAEQWLRNADYAASKSETRDAKARLERVKELLIELLPDVDEIRIQARGHEVPVPEAKTPFGWVAVNSLSTGYRSVLAWVIDFASRMMDRYPRARNPLAMPAVVLVDQIDLYLHPKWQREVMERLSRIFKKTQFIVTAHSPLIVQATPGANLALLKRVGNEVHILNQPEEVRGWRTDQLLASDLFENQPTRDEETEEMMEARQELLAKTRLSLGDKRRLQELNARLGEIPYGESPEQAEMLAVLKKAAASTQRAARKR